MLKIFTLSAVLVSGGVGSKCFKPLSSNIKLAECEKDRSWLTKIEKSSKTKTKSSKSKVKNKKTKPKLIVKTAKKYIGTRYKYGANSRHAVDCSSFVQRVFKQVHTKLPRTSREQAKVGKRVKKSELKPGDLVFFSSKKTRGVAHVGIYIGGGKFIHASSGAKKVTITPLNKRYYKKHFKGARRVS